MQSAEVKQKSSTIQHTPGPWKWFYSDERKGHEQIGIHGPSDSDTFAYAYIQNPEQQANARLIAAAPELLEALKMLAKCTERLLLPADVASKAEAAIAKAEGR